MTTQDLAITHAQECRRQPDPVAFMLRCAWISLALLYDEIKIEITPIEKLDLETKKKYWNQTEGSKFKRILQCQALYVWELLNIEIDEKIQP